LKLAGQIPVQQNSFQCRDSIARAHAALTAGKTIVIFPEGELVPPGKRIRCKTGAVRLALKADVPIIPLGMYVPSQNTLELGFTRNGHKHTGLWQISGNCYLNFGSPWKPRLSQAEPTSIHDLTRELMDNIYKLVSETRKELTCASYTSLNPILR
jgi:1-acyl-sn-glycerol-3-phosphate acyltransferase